MTILFEKQQNGVARITLNRPDVHNAFNEQMISDLTDAFAELEKCSKTRMVILSGKGKSFCAGADLDWMKRAAGFSSGENYADAIRLSDMLNALHKLKQLTITSVQGAVMGGGLGLVSCSDIVIAKSKTKFALSEVNLGLIPATISPFVIEAIGARQAKRYFQTGEFFDSQQALKMGLIHEISESNETLEKIVNIALKSAPEAMQKSKSLVLEISGKSITDQLRQDTASRIAKIRAGDEAKEGLQAFFDKRKADWIKDV
ncbi:MAG: enoyl-CoA hydratase/isomerase family protein [Kordiimonadaceae bacterium]|jgi:methylglutaconyl-CoA hydratase|nr:enoyl-CoA hydratase/isomerase family protein [Kordiimonadaceae bacterium]MBT6033463.1 enoyl-CoA hydratase/isomerase family protein [Kordiimonadaceae bacterium]